MGLNRPSQLLRAIGQKPTEAAVGGPTVLLRPASSRRLEEKQWRFGIREPDEVMRITFYDICMGWMYANINIYVLLYIYLYT